MTFTFPCRRCGRDNLAELGQCGRRVACSGCGQTIKVPAPRETIETPESGPKTKFACGRCRRRYAVAVAMAGQRVPCPSCGAELVVPDPSAGSGSIQSATAANRPIGATQRPFEIASPAPTPEFRERPGPSPRPSAGVPLDAGLPLDALPLDAARERRPGRGGRNEEVAETILPSRSEALAALAARAATTGTGQGETAMEDRGPAPRKKRRRKKRSSSGLNMQDVYTMVGAVAVVDVMLGGLAWGYSGLRTPLALMLTGLGGVLTWAGTLGFSRVAREEGVIYGLLCKVVPLYKVYYLYTRWQVMREHFAFYAVGLLLVYPGVIMYRFSPLYEKVHKGPEATIERRDEADPATPRPILPSAAESPAEAGDAPAAEPRP